MDPNKFSSEHIENEERTFTSKPLSSEYFLDTKLQSKFDKYD